MNNIWNLNVELCSESAHTGKMNFEYTFIIKKKSIISTLLFGHKNDVKGLRFGDILSVQTENSGVVWCGVVVYATLIVMSVMNNFSIFIRRK